MRFGHAVCPWTELVTSTFRREEARSPNTAGGENVSSRGTNFENGGGEGAKIGKQFSLDLNFGEMEFDFEARTMTSRVMGVKGGGDRPLLSAQWTFDQLSGREVMLGGRVGPEDAAQEMRRQQSLSAVHGGGVGDWVCVNHRGAPHPIGVIGGSVAGMGLLLSFLLLPYVLLFMGTAWVLRALHRARSRLTEDKSTFVRQ